MVQEVLTGRQCAPTSRPGRVANENGAKKGASDLQNDEGPASAGPQAVPLPGFEPAYGVASDGVADRKCLLTRHFRQLGLGAIVAGWRGAC
jgi:hypothetical protein